MSDSLRDALVEHLARRYWEHGMGGQWERPAGAPDAPFPAYAGEQEKTECRAYVRELLAGFDLAAHPVEPAPCVSDKAVQVAESAFYEHPASHGMNSKARQRAIRAALEAAQPFMGPAPRTRMVEAAAAAVRREGAEDPLAAVRKLHAADFVPQPSQFHAWCTECNCAWPCPTAKILDDLA